MNNCFILVNRGKGAQLETFLVRESEEPSKIEQQRTLCCVTNNHVFSILFHSCRSSVPSFFLFLTPESVPFPADTLFFLWETKYLLKICLEISRLLSWLDLALFCVRLSPPTLKPHDHNCCIWSHKEFWSSFFFFC